MNSGNFVVFSLDYLLEMEVRILLQCKNDCMSTSGVLECLLDCA